MALAFDSLDLDKDGKISLDELKDGLFAKQLKLFISEEQAKKVINMFDKDGDGAIQLEEFQGVEAFRSKLDLILR